MTIIKFFSALITVLIASSILLSNVYANEIVIPSQVFIDEENLDIFIDNVFEEDNLRIKVSKREAEIVECGRISEKNVSVRTTLLVDISSSMPVAARNEVIEYINLSIENLAPNEQMRIIAFDTETNMLQDFTSDRYDLDKATEKIKFKGKGSAVFDAVYNTIPKIELQNTKPCFYRTILITDGMDYTNQGITKEELLLKLQANTYPIDVICVSAEQSDKQDKELSALTRISMGKYFCFYPTIDIETLLSDISAKNYFWIRAEIPIALLDGSTRQIDVFDGTNAASFDAKMSVVDVPIEEASTPSSTTTAYSTSEPILTTSNPISPVTYYEEELSITNVIIFVAIGVFVVVAVIVVIMVIKKKKSQSIQINSNSNHVLSASQTTEMTELLDEYESKELFSIKISNISNQNESWVLDVSSDIIIGRGEKCAIRFDDTSVSREQCKIAIDKNGLVISNISTSNKTKLNGVVLATEVLLHPADTIRFGRITLRVDYIQKVTDESPDSRNSSIDMKKELFGTKSIFR